MLENTLYRACVRLSPYSQIYYASIHISPVANPTPTIASRPITFYYRHNHDATTPSRRHAPATPSPPVPTAVSQVESLSYHLFSDTHFARESQCDRPAIDPAVTTSFDILHT